MPVRLELQLNYECIGRKCNIYIYIYIYEETYIRDGICGLATEKDIFRFHGVQLMIVSDRDLHYVSHFWNSLHEVLDIKLQFSAAFHP